MKNNLPGLQRALETLKWYRETEESKEDKFGIEEEMRDLEFECSSSDQGFIQSLKKLIQKEKVNFELFLFYTF